MKAPVLLCSHCGLGDMLICNGLVRTLARAHCLVAVVVKRVYAESVCFMYRDLSNVHLVTVNDDSDISPRFGAPPDALSSFATAGFQVLLLGLHRGPLPPGSGFADVLYDQAGIPRRARYDAFHVQRDLDLERLFARDGRYRFYHDDPERGFSLQLPRDALQAVHPGKADKREGAGNIFAFIGLMEKAVELHLIDSCFAHLCDLLDLRPDNRTLHCYAKNRDDLPDLLYRRPGWSFQWDRPHAVKGEGLAQGCAVVGKLP